MALRRSPICLMLGLLISSTGVSSFAADQAEKDLAEACKNAQPNSQLFMSCYSVQSIKVQTAPSDLAPAPLKPLPFDGEFGNLNVIVPSPQAQELREVVLPRQPKPPVRRSKNQAPRPAQASAAAPAPPAAAMPLAPQERISLNSAEDERKNNPAKISPFTMTSFSTPNAVNLGINIWNFIVDNAGVSKINDGGGLAILPSDSSSWNQLENWNEQPVVKSMTVRMTNVMGLDVVRFRYTVRFSYGGRFKGKGRYLQGLRLSADVERVLPGFQLAADIEVDPKDIINLGTEEDPVPQTTITIHYSVKSPIMPASSHDTFFVSGNGTVASEKEMAEHNTPVPRP